MITIAKQYFPEWFDAVNEFAGGTLSRAIASNAAVMGSQHWSSGDWVVKIEGSIYVVPRRLLDVLVPEEQA